MTYNPTNDFVGLWRAQTGGAVKAEMPGLDFVIAALARAGILNVVFSTSAPASNQDTTAWFKTTSPSYQGEGTLYLWDSSANAYAIATPDLYADFLSSSGVGSGGGGGGTTTAVGVLHAYTSGVPGSGMGQDGDFCIQTTGNGAMFGPKAGGFWPGQPLPATCYTQVSNYLDHVSPSPMLYALTYNGLTDWQPLQPGTAGQLLQTGGNGAPPAWVSATIYTKNLILNGSFRVNQGLYVSGAVLAAGAYGHDQWKAGASGGDYTFTQFKSSTFITIATGKSLIQPIEDANVGSTAYVLSWQGTSQARVGVNTLTPSGAYAPGPILITGQTAGTVMSVEFNAGSLGNVKLELGNTATPFVMQPFGEELALCRRYFFTDTTYIGAPSVGFYSSIYSFAPMRIVPAFVLSGIAYTSASGLGALFPSQSSVAFQAQNTAINGFVNFTFTANARL